MGSAWGEVAKSHASHCKIVPASMVGVVGDVLRVFGRRGGAGPGGEFLFCQV